MRKLLLGLCLLVVLVFGWHLMQVGHVADELTGDASPEMLVVTINPITNVARFRINLASSEEAMDRMAAEFFFHALHSGREELEQEMALIARERLDVYAMLFPYRVRVIR